MIFEFIFGFGKTLDRYRAIAGVGIVLLQVGCSAKLPLCPKIAAKSFEGYNPSAIVNNYILEQARARNVTIQALSPFAAEVSGLPTELEWFERNYKHMLCAFNPRVEVDDRSTYLSCMQHADEWIVITREKPENLMLTQTKFHEACSTPRE
jgi:hypothetical protein